MGKVRILLVDDEEDLGVIFNFQFREWIKAGHVSLDFITDSRDAKDLFLKAEDAPYELVITDMNMPNVDGLEITELVNTKFKDTKVYILTAYDTQSHKEDAEHAGIDRFMAKPLSFEDLKKSIQTDFNIPN